MFFESNPWNPVLWLRRFAGSMVGNRDPRQLLNRHELCEVLAECGFVSVMAVHNDFVYAPLNRRFIWLLRNLSLVFENMPVIQKAAGAIFVHAEKPALEPQSSPSVSICEHAILMHTVSFVIPCHNEEMNVRPVVKKLLDLYGDYVHEIVLVDDNSRDETAQVIFSLAAEESRIIPVIRKPPNGVGRALADGYRVATGQYILTMDCDFAHLLPEFRDLFDAAANGFDVVVESRFSRHSVLLNYPFQKIIANRLFHVLARLAFRGSFRDLTNNLKLMRREVVRNLQLTEPGSPRMPKQGFSRFSWASKSMRCQSHG